MPARKIPKNYKYITGQISSTKAIGEACFEASLEPDFLHLLEFDPRVKAFEVQPCHIYWKDHSGKTHRYTPDCRVFYNDPRLKPLLVEIKYRSFLLANWETLRPAYRAAVHAATLEGSRFTIFTEREIRTPYLERVKFLLPIVRRGADETSIQRILSLMREMKVATPQQLMDHMSSNIDEQAVLLPALWYAMGTFQLEVDLNLPLTMNSRIASLE